MAALLAAVLCLFVIAFSLLSSQVSYSLQNDYSVRKPFLMVYTATSGLAALFALTWLEFRCSRGWRESFKENVKETTGFYILPLIKTSAPFGFLSVLSNYLFNFSLSYTALPIALALESSALLFIVLLAIKILPDRESLDGVKLFALFLCLSGVSFIAVGDFHQAPLASPGNSGPGATWEHAALLGDLACLLSAVAAALYMVLFPKVFPFTGLRANFLWLGSIGISTIAIYWVPLIILDRTGIESLQTLQDEQAKNSANVATLLALLFGVAASSVCFNFCLSLGISRFSPVLLKVAMIFTIPISFFLNPFESFNAWNLSGAAGIFLGCLIFSARQIAALRQAKEENKEKEKLLNK